MEPTEFELLSEAFPTAADAAWAIDRMEAQRNLPAGTELFASDIHGEHAAFAHILRNACGAIRRHIDGAFGESMSEGQRAQLACLVYYPEEKLPLLLQGAGDRLSWFEGTVGKLAAVLRRVAGNCARADVEDAFPDEFAFAATELLVQRFDVDQAAYASSLVDAVYRTGRAEAFVCALCHGIQQLAVTRLHMVGDVYDRGPAPDAIMDDLMAYHSVDIQWGNHDIVWMGAALGQRGCIAHVVRNCARYGNLSILEDSYGMDISALKEFALEAYRDDPCKAFGLKVKVDLPPEELDLNVKIQKAMAIIQFKVEAQLIDENPSFGLQERKLLHRIDPQKGTVVVDGVEYEVADMVFPTVDWSDPYRLTEGEQAAMRSLQRAFMDNARLQRHIHFFLEAGSFYSICNGILLYHACVPLNADGSLMEVDVYGQTYKGRALFDAMERYVRDAFFADDASQRKRGADLIWYLWLGKGSPLFAKSKMATFEIYLIADKAARKEVKNPYYSLLDDERVINGILEDFGMDPATSRIVSGHVPVKVKDGEDPVKCHGRAMIIDGGFSRAYQGTTGIAGMTLVSDSHGLTLYSHEPLESTAAAIERNVDIASTPRVLETYGEQRLVAQTDEGRDLQEQVAKLEELLQTYRERQQ